MTITGVQTIGIIGAGNIGSQVARLALAHGYDVVISNSREPQTLAGLVSELGPRARAAVAADAGAAGDLVVVTVPLKAISDVPVGPLAGKTVIDTNNYYPERDGRIPSLDDGSTTSSALLQAHLPTSTVVKGFNHIQAAQLTTDATPSGSAARRALAVAGDDTTAKAQVAELLDELGFDSVDLGTLAESWRIEPGTPGYGPQLDVEGLSAALASAQRQHP